MVAHISAVMERHLSIASSRTHPLNLFRCLRLMGLWCQRRELLVYDSCLSTQQGLSTRSPTYMCLLASLFFFCATYIISLPAHHIAGVLNKSADALSCNNLPLFLIMNPQVQPQPTVVPDELLELVSNRNLLWTSPNWTSLFTTILASVLPPLLVPPIPQPSVASYHSGS